MFMYAVSGKFVDESAHGSTYNVLTINLIILIEVELNFTQKYGIEFMYQFSTWVTLLKLVIPSKYQSYLTLGKIPPSLNRFNRIIHKGTWKINEHCIVSCQAATKPLSLWLSQSRIFSFPLCFPPRQFLLLFKCQKISDKVHASHCTYSESF